MQTVWKFQEGLKKVYIEENDVKEEILSLNGPRLHCRYYKEGKLEAWDIIYPESIEGQINQILLRKDA